MPNNRPGWGALLPRFNIPETFGAAISYEAQLHWFLENWNDVAEYANALEQPTVDVAGVNVIDSNSAVPDVRNVGTSLNARLEFDIPEVYTRFADPLTWDFDSSYELLTVVSDGSGNSYTSRQAVPEHVALTNTDYWVRTGNYDAALELAYQQIEDTQLGYVRVYKTVADMQADEWLTPPMICRTLGFYSAGDGGGAWYVIGVDTSGINGIDVLSLAVAGAASLIISPYEPKTVRMSKFGCIGDGSDMTARIKRALSFVSSGWTVLFDVDNCLVTDTLQINSNNVNVIGNDKAYSWLTFRDVSGYCLEINAHGCKIQGMRLQNGDAVDITGVTDDKKCVRVVDLTDTDFYNIDFECENTAFIYFANAITTYGKNANIHNCIFSNCLNGVTFTDDYDGRGETVQRRGLIVRDCTFHGGDPSFISDIDIDTLGQIKTVGVINTHGSRETIVTGNNFNSDYYGYMYRGVADNTEISNNTCERHSSACGLAVFHPALGAVMSGTCKIAGNNLAFKRTPSAQQSEYVTAMYPIYIDTPATYVYIANNAFNNYSSILTASNTATLYVVGNFAMLTNVSTNLGVFNARGYTGNKTLHAAGNLINAASGYTYIETSDTEYKLLTDPVFDTANYRNTTRITVRS